MYSNTPGTKLKILRYNSLIQLENALNNIIVNDPNVIEFDVKFGFDNEYSSGGDIYSVLVIYKIKEVI